MRKALLIVTTLAIIVTAGITQYLIMNYVSNRVAHEAEANLATYQQTQEPSYLYQATILDPSRANLHNLYQVLLEDGDYRAAELINRWFRLDPQNELYISFLLQGGDLDKARGLIGQLGSSQRDEYLAFLNLAEQGSVSALLESPQTDLGILYQTIVSRDFSNIDDEYGLAKKISQSISGQGREQSLVTVANLLRQRNLPRIGLYLLDELPCNLSSATQEKAKILSDLGRSGAALKELECALEYNPVDPDLLRMAVELTKNSNNETKSENYQEHLDYLNKLAD